MTLTIFMCSGYDVQSCWWDTKLICNKSGSGGGMAAAACRSDPARTL